MYSEEIKHFLDNNTVYILEAPNMISKKSSRGRDYRCLIRLTKHDANLYRKYEKLSIIRNWLSILGNDYGWINRESSLWWDVESKIRNAKSYWWEWKDTHKDTFEYIERDDLNDTLRQKRIEYEGLKNNWRQVHGDERIRVLKRNRILDRAYKSLVVVKLYEDLDSRWG